MEGKKLLTEKNIVIFYIIMFSVGVAGHLIAPLQGLIIPLTPFTLLLLGGITVLISQAVNEKKFLVWFVLTYAATFLIEAAGVKTGMIFGSYQYGDTLGLKVLDVPLIIGFNWVIVILGAVIFAEKFSGNIFVISLLAAVFAVLFDVILEPVAIQLNYWRWEGDAIPLQNYFAWFVISFSAALFYKFMKIEFRSLSPVHYLIAQAVFFIILLAFI